MTVPSHGRQSHVATRPLPLCDPQVHEPIDVAFSVKRPWREQLHLVSYYVLGSLMMVILGYTFAQLELEHRGSTLPAFLSVLALAFHQERRDLARVGIAFVAAFYTAWCVYW